MFFPPQVVTPMPACDKGAGQRRGCGLPRRLLLGTDWKVHLVQKIGAGVPAGTRGRMSFGSRRICSRMSWSFCPMRAQEGQKVKIPPDSFNLATVWPDIVIDAGDRAVSKTDKNTRLPALTF